MTLVVNDRELVAKRIGLQASPKENYIEWVPLDKVTGLELNPHVVNPSLTVIDERGRWRIYPLNPESLVHVRPGAAKPAETFEVGATLALLG